MLRVVAYAPDGVQRFAIQQNELLIGSEPGCDVYLPYTGVAQSHARLRVDGERVRIEDLGSRKGLTVAGRRVKEAPLELLDEVRVGSVTLLIEDVTPDPRQAFPFLRAAAGPREPRITPEVMLVHLSEIGNWVLADVESRIPLEALTSALLADFGGGALFLLHGDLVGELGSKFVSATQSAWLSAGLELLDQVREQAGTGPAGPRSGSFRGHLGGEASWVGYHAFDAVERPYLLIIALPSQRESEWSPAGALGVLGDLLVLGLVHHVGWYEPILPGRLAQRELVLDPALVVGESELMKGVIAQMRMAVDPEVTLLLRGEPGVGRELLARSLHASGPRRDKPFVMALCSGTSSAAMIEADLFGSEVLGRESVVRREGKLVQAHRGTLFLADVEKLPLDLQARLVRFLRTKQVEPAGSRQSIEVDVRLVAASSVPLESLVARDAFRVDLTYRLSQFAIDVPAVRQRREDLPLLIQGAINRFCHETGKRMQGITVKAMSALLAYDFPGNLAELDNVARQLVYLCPPGKPIDVNLLPEKIRLSNLQAPKVDASSDLDLENLLASTERAAIREALRRAGSNKSQAARLLGLSRNGLAMKMERHGIKG